jgi:DNA (cytosine-5)-methyltransferase 1
LENVRGHLSLGLKEVLQGLTSIGYDARWQIVRASDVGAPHQRARLFIVAYPAGFGCENFICDSQSNEFEQSLTTNTDSYAREKSRRADRGIPSAPSEIINGPDRSINRRSREDASHTDYQYQPYHGQMQELGRRFTSRRQMHMQEPPDALDQSGRLSALFVEYMMGLPSGWVTNQGLSRSQQLKMLGNGVVPQQAEYALELLLGGDTDA